MQRTQEEITVSVLGPGKILQQWLKHWDKDIMHQSELQADHPDRACEHHTCRSIALGSCLRTLEYVDRQTGEKESLFHCTF